MKIHLEIKPPLWNSEDKITFSFLLKKNFLTKFKDHAYQIAQPLDFSNGTLLRREIFHSVKVSSKHDFYKLIRKKDDYEIVSSLVFVGNGRKQLGFRRKWKKTEVECFLLFLNLKHRLVDRVIYERAIFYQYTNSIS